MTPSHPAADALLPCPLCGGDPVLDGRSDDVRVRCETGCGAQGPVSYFDADDFDAIDAAEAEAKARWNTRAALSAHSGQAAQAVDLTDAQCEAVYRAVSMSGLTRDVKTPERQREIVRAAITHKDTP